MSNFVVLREQASSGTLGENMLWIEALIVVVLSLSMVVWAAWIVCKLCDVADCLQGEVPHESGHTPQATR